LDSLEDASVAIVRVNVLLKVAGYVHCELLQFRFHRWQRTLVAATRKAPMASARQPIPFPAILYTPRGIGRVADVLRELCRDECLNSNWRWVENRDAAEKWCGNFRPLQCRLRGL
jgi:hypothetical protein